MIRNRTHLALAIAATMPLFTQAANSPRADQALTRAAQKLGVERNAALEISATGSWYQFGQAPAPGLAWPKFDVSNYRATFDFDASAARVEITRKQVIEAGRERPAPVEQRVDQYVAGDLAWNVPSAPAASAAPPPASQPAALAERRAELVSTPQGFIRAALARGASVARDKGSSTVSFQDGAARYEGVLDAAGNLTLVRTWIDNPVLGDTLVETRFADYQDFAGVKFPRSIQRSLGGFPVLDLQVKEVRSASTGTLSVPATVSANAPSPEVKSRQLAPGVFYLTGGTHHSVLVEQADHLVVIEGPQNEARSLAVIAKSKELVPGKAIRYVVNTHAHFDHSGGLRTYVDEGAIVVTDAANRGYYEQAWSAPRTLNPDRLAKSGKQPKFEAVNGKHVLAGTHPVELHAIKGSGHNDAFLLVYLPVERLLVEADAWTPAAANAPAPTSLNPFTVNLLDNVERLKLDVAQVAALHGPRLVSLKDLRVAAGRPAPAPQPENASVERAIPGVVAAGTPIEYVSGGFEGTEGPLPLPDGTLVFAENRVDRLQRVANDGTVSLFSEANFNPNALATAPDGSIVAAQTARPGIGVIHPADKVRPLATEYQGKPFNRPNDLIVDRKGGVWFTDPGAGPAQRAPGAAESAVKAVPAVYHLSEKGDLRQLTTDIARPNGIALSPDEKTLYVANTYGEYVIAYPVGADGVVGKPRDFAKLVGFAPAANNAPASSGADGLAVDEAGRLYVASSAGVEVFNARGKALGVIKLPKAPQNLAFGGADRRTLYVVGRGAVWKLRTEAAGPANRAK